MLVILTLLAISGMNAASTELIMAGNEQYRQKAFNASAAGIEDGLTKLATIPQDPNKSTDVPKTAVKDGDAGESFETSSLYVGDSQNVSGYSAGRFVGLNYEIRSTGTATRNATSVQTQGAYVVQAAGGNGDVPYGSIVTP
jgi:Tfp pilus assembly protein PilX